MSDDHEDPRRDKNAEAYAQAQQALQTIIGGMTGRRPNALADSQPATPYEPDAALKATLAELETVRQQTKKQVYERLFSVGIKSVPIGVLLSLLLSWFLFGTTDRHHVVFGVGKVIQFAIVGAAFGGLWAWTAAQLVVKAYNKLFKERVMPTLLAGFGGHLEWRSSQPSLDEFKRYHLFPHWDYSNSTDEIHGDYRGIPLSIFDLDITAREGKQTVLIFGGIMIALTLPRGLQGVTVVSAQGAISNFAEHLFDGLQSVHLEDPAFAKTFQVHSSDQVSARALLTPAFMERFLHLATIYGTPEVMTEDKRFFIALPTGKGSLFTPPSYRDPVAAREALTRFHQNIATYLHVVDAVIDLDQGARAQAAQSDDSAAAH
ncbi:MAG: DUF3137 domain-containing protein [Betaproteobacteria bacterium]|nr:DUF3137 domain-containing protein [Betaproteobacteria bacterium]